MWHIYVLLHCTIFNSIAIIWHTAHVNSHGSLNTSKSDRWTCFGLFIGQTSTIVHNILAKDRKTDENLVNTSLCYFLASNPFPTDHVDFDGSTPRLTSHRNWKINLWSISIFHQPVCMRKRGRAENRAVQGRRRPNWGGRLSSEMKRRRALKKGEGGVLKAERDLPLSRRPSFDALERGTHQKEQMKIGLGG